MAFKQEDRLQVAQVSMTPAINVFGAGQILTNVSAEVKRVWAIWGIEVFFTSNPLSTDDLAAGESNVLRFQLTHSVQVSLINDNNPDILHQKMLAITRSAAIGTDAGPLWIKTEIPIATWFPKPIPFGGPAINVGVQSFNLTTPPLFTTKVYYTVVTVSTAEFLEINRCR